jgi:hypothetical protein
MTTGKFCLEVEKCLPPGAKFLFPILLALGSCTSINITEKSAISNGVEADFSV